MFKSIFRKSIALLLTTSLLSGVLLAPGNSLPEAQAEEAYPTFERLAGKDRYETAVQISSKDWEEAYNVVLARGDGDNSFADALTGAVLANSAGVKGPLLLTHANKLNAEVLKEIKRLNTRTVFILGGTNAISAEIEATLKSSGLVTVRLGGEDRYETAVQIAARAVGNSQEAFIASGENFPDALSISAYAAAKGIPLLLTKKGQVPESTLKGLKDLGVTKVTLIGGETVIPPAIATEFSTAGYSVERVSGPNRYDTNIEILNKYSFNTSRAVIATGATFPDALAGSVLAAKGNNPIVLVPQREKALLEYETANYLAYLRTITTETFILGGFDVLNYKVESIIRTGGFNIRVSLQFWDGYQSKTRYEDLINNVPGKLTDYIDILAPNFVGALQSNGSFAYRFSSAAIPKSLVALGQSKGARVVPLIMGSDSVADAILEDPAKRRNFVASAQKVIRETGADGIMVDLEVLKDSNEHNLTALMRELYNELHPQGKLVMICVMSRTSPSAEPWLREYNYKDLAKYTDYVQIMSYDKHYSTSQPGPIAPLNWVEQVMAYAVTQIPRDKILMGIPYYGRSWTQDSAGKWTSFAFGWGEAQKIARDHNATIKRDAGGIPYFEYQDSEGKKRTAYFDDLKSWGDKLKLLDRFQLGGVGGWAMYWLDEEIAPEFYSLLKSRLR
jgi:spore germination protein YaaH/putative cell wall-binding protein